VNKQLVDACYGFVALLKLHVLHNKSLEQGQVIGVAGKLLLELRDLRFRRTGVGGIDRRQHGTHGALLLLDALELDGPDRPSGNYKGPTFGRCWR